MRVSIFIVSLCIYLYVPIAHAQIAGINEPPITEAPSIHTTLSDNAPPTPEAPAPPPRPPAQPTPLSLIEQEMSKPIGVPLAEVENKLTVSTDDYWDYQYRTMIYDLMKAYRLQQDAIATARKAK